jgi:hypothetical protein
MSTALITFGCSWTFGVGVGYEEGMKRPEYEKIAWEKSVCDQLSFRGLLSQKYNLVNVNFSIGGSSNQTQFRLAKEFFSSTNFKKLQLEFEKIIVLWGITSTARNELYLNSRDSYENIFYSYNTPESKIMLKYFYNHDHEIRQLVTEMRFWNDYFESKNINNLWFDTFNHHKYGENQFNLDYDACAGPDWPNFDDYLTGNCVISQEINDKIVEIKNLCKQQSSTLIYTKIKKNLIFEEKNPRDLLSLLAINNGKVDIDTNYHISDWLSDSNRVDYLIKCNILNPISYHPTKIGHEQIATILSPHIEALL